MITPKRVTLYAGMLALLTGIVSCCQKKYCPGGDSIGDIRFYGFMYTDVDSVTVLVYEKNSAHDVPLDSIPMLRQPNNPDLGFELVDLPYPLTWEKDYEVRLPSTGEVFRITEMTVKKSRCNTGFMCQDHYNALHSYKVNGQVREDGLLKIFR